MKESDQEIRIWQMEASLMRLFLEKFATFEKCLNDCFSKNVELLDQEKLAELFFYAAHLMEVKNIDFSKQHVERQIIKFSSARDFSCFSTSRILKLQKHQKILNFLDKKIQSINNSMIVYELVDCCLKLLLMRNKLAHERCQLELKQDDAIELLSDNEISKYENPFVPDVNIEELNYSSRILFSNIMYIDKLIACLKEDEFERLKSG